MKTKKITLDEFYSILAKKKNVKLVNPTKYCSIIDKLTAKTDYEFVTATEKNISMPGLRIDNKLIFMKVI